MMKKEYIKPSMLVFQMSLSAPLCISTGAPSEDVDDSRSSKKFEGSTGFLWEDDTNEK